MSDAILLRDVQENDIKDLVEISFYDAKPASTVEEARIMQQRINADYDNGSSIHWCITNRITGELMGTLGYYRGFDKETGELGFVLKPGSKGKGVMTEAIKLAIHFGFNSMGLTRIKAVTSKQNFKAIALLERLQLIRQTEFTSDDEVEYSLKQINP